MSLNFIKPDFPRGEYNALFPDLKRIPKKFKLYTRMSLLTFDYIMSKVSGPLTKNWCNLHDSPILQEERFVITLRFLVTGNSYSALSFSFKIGISTVSGIILECLDVLWNIFTPIHMPVPTESDFVKISNEFFCKWGVPNCIGSIDGKHVRIKKPAHSGTLFYNYKNYFSSVLQATVDANGKFIMIEIYKYGSQSDGAIFYKSKLVMNIHQRKLKIPTLKKLPWSEEKLPYYFIGDGAYPLREYLMKPMRGQRLTTQESNYNYRLSRARCVVENSFGRISKKWEVLQKTIQQKPENVEKVIKGICILHNILIDKNDKTLMNDVKYVNEQEVQEDKQQRYDSQQFQHQRLAQKGAQSRSRLMEWFAKYPLHNG
ncbi:hypothetical protein TKK_0002103 [Trichogramma kaykai]|uniref:DDE Tnp4 domain-containing protein n=1 Tax=Trichogramma kaykai TaxID=54128 RepID=A0ABD2X8T7_9HYME